MRPYFIVAITGVLLAVAPGFGAQMSNWQPGDMPIVYYVNADDAAAWPEGVGAIVRSFMSWERIAGAHVRFHYAGTTDKRFSEGDGQNVVSWMKERWPYGNDAVAYAVLWVSTDAGRIVEADLILNAEHFAWATDGDGDAVDVQDVITHEGGHALGLPHSVTSPDLTMFPVVVRGETTKRVITEEERLTIRMLYPSGMTSIFTYAFSAGSGELLAEPVASDYPSVPGSARIFLMTRVDADAGDGLDEIGAILEEDGRLAFRLFPAVTSGVPSSEPLAYDEWSIPRGDIMDLTSFDIDGDGIEEIGVLRAMPDGTFALSVYDSPRASAFTAEDSPLLVIRQRFRTAAGDNITAAVGFDYDGDGIDEVGVVRLTATGLRFLDVYWIGGRATDPPIASIFLGSDFDFIDLDVSDINSDGEPELIALGKDARGWYVSAFLLPYRNVLPEDSRVTLLATAPIALPAGHQPMRISSLRVAGPDGSPRPSICILLGQNL